MKTIFRLFFLAALLPLAAFSQVVVSGPALFPGSVAAGGGGGSGTPGGSDTQVQYNNAGAFGGASGLIFGGTAGKLTLGVAGSIVGTIDLKNATSGTITLSPPTGALGTVTLTAQATTGTIYSTGGTDVAVADGGTGASAVAGARVNLNITTQAISASAIDWDLGGTHSKTLGANTTFTFSNDTDGETITVALTNTASNYTVTWPTVVWSGGVAPVQTIGAKTDIYTFKKIGSTIYGSVTQNFF